jgi:hypothetical protein
MTDVACTLCVAAELPAERWAWRGRHWHAASIPHVGADDVLILQTRRCVDGIWNLEPDEAAELGPAIRLLTAGVRAVTGAARVYVVASGEKNLHPHFALMPRPADVPESQRGLEHMRSKLIGAAASQEAKVAFVARVAASIAEEEQGTR